MSKHATAAKTVSVKLDSEMRDRIKHLADARNRTAHWVMREAIAQYVVQEEKRESFRQATLAAWREYQDTGLHVTGEEVDAWLASWGTDNELPAPACHP
ncbi:MAG: CopG family ribbon-helix-helix protein [Castellaniella sp.]|uniref:CopG family ribbon-helix-helix protein n=1 Tax=Castellaniella sp. TaxID=1955812 RepID=UPI003C72B627